MNAYKLQTLFGPRLQPTNNFCFNELFHTYELAWVLQLGMSPCHRSRLDLQAEFFIVLTKIGLVSMVFAIEKQH